MAAPGGEGGPAANRCKGWPNAPRAPILEAMHRRLFLSGALGLVGASAARAAPLSISSQGAVDAYAERLQAGLDRTGDGRFLTDTEQDLFAAHQAIRGAHGLTELEPHPGLALAARAHAADQSIRHYFAHESPDGFGPTERVGLLARTFLGLPGENIADCQGRWLGVAPQVLMDSWMDSPGHRDNVLRARFTHLGLGAVQNGRRTLAVAVFGQRFAELNEPLPRAPTSAQITRALEAASPAIDSYDLSPVGHDEREGSFGAGQSPAGLRAGPYILRPRMSAGGRQFTIVLGPIVDLNG
jgi:uncharacterized protein YkwD